MLICAGMTYLAVSVYQQTVSSLTDHVQEMPPVSRLLDAKTLSNDVDMLNARAFEYSTHTHGGVVPTDPSL